MCDGVSLELKTALLDSCLDIYESSIMHRARVVSAPFFDALQLSIHYNKFRNQV